MGSRRRRHVRRWRSPLRPHCAYPVVRFLVRAHSGPLPHSSLLRSYTLPCARAAHCPLPTAYCLPPALPTALSCMYSRVQAFAEQYITDGLLSGVVTSRSSKAIQV